MAFLARVSLCALIALALALPANAAAKPGCGPAPAPTGNSELDQYVESAPGPCGEDQIRRGGSGQGGGAGILPAETREQLQAQGPDGRAAAALAEANAPDAPNAPNTGGATGEVQEEIERTSDDGMGILLPLILAGTLAAGILYFVRRRRAGLA